MLKKMFQQDDAASHITARGFEDCGLSWEDLEQLLQQGEQAHGCAPEDLETGRPSSKALRRTFGQPADSIRVHLYRDSAAWCPYCQKVWLLLEEKRVPYTIEKINMRCYGAKPAHFTRKVPAGLLPVVEIDGELITESDDIMAALEATFPERPMLPEEGSAAAQRARALMRLERQHFSAWLQWLCSPRGHKQAREAYEVVLEQVEAALQEGPYFLGDEISMVDMVFAPFLERAAASLAYYKGYFVRGRGRWPAIERWFAAMEARDTYLATRSDFYTHCHDLPPQLGGCAMHADGQPVAAQIDGTADGAWRLPLAPLDPASLPEPYSPGDNPPRDRVVAAQSLVRNHAAVTGFAARGAGAQGLPPVSAPLSDPNAEANDVAKPYVDAALRHVAHALLVGTDDKAHGEHALQVADGSVASGKDSQGSAQAVASLEYLAKRIGVPRDMPLPAARQLRAHINWFVDAVAA